MPIVGASAASSNTNLGGTIVYNGWSFKSPRFRSSLSMSPEPSADGRTTLCNVYRLEVRGFITDDANSANGFNPATQTTLGSQYVTRGNLQTMRGRLSKSGGRLQIIGLGFDIDINSGDNGGLFDTRWGPKCLKCDFRNVGNGLIWEIHWVCKFALAECAVLTSAEGHPDHTAYSGILSDVSYLGFPFLQGDVEGLVFEVAYTINESGLTQRVIRGEVSIAINRASATGDGDFNKVVAVADQVRENIDPQIPLHFRRIRQDWVTSSDRRTLKFTIIDEELASENAFPPGVIDMQLDHSVHAEAEMLPATAKIFCNFDGSIEVAKGYSYALAFNKVLLIMQQRLDAARIVFQIAIGDNTKNPVFVTGIQLREAMYGKRIISFSVSYLILAEGGAGMFGDFIGRSGIFLPVNVAGVDDETWRASLSGPGNVFDQRGISGLAFDPSQDAIVGPCEGAGGTATGSAQYPLAVSQSGGSLVTDCPSLSVDNLYYSNEISVETKSGRVQHSPMAAQGSVASAIGSIQTADGAAISPSYRSPGSIASAVSSTRVSSSSMITFVMIGRAIRLGKPPEIPKVNISRFHELSTAGRLSEGDSVVSSKRGGKIGSCPVYTASWRIPYTLLGAVTNADVQDIIDDMNNALIQTESDPTGSKVGGATEEQ